MSKVYYSEEDVKEIIRKAAELQQQTDQSSDTEKGLSMDDLMEIGGDLGLNLDHIKTAANEYKTQNIERYSDLNDTHIFEEREFAANVSEDLIWDEVVAELTHHFGVDMYGKTKENARKKEWTHTSMSGIATVVTLSKRNSRAKLRFSQRVGLGSSLTEGVGYGAIVAFVLFSTIGLSLKPSLVENIAIGSSLWALSSILVYSLDVAWRKRKLKGLKSLADKIVNQIPTDFEVVKSKSIAKEDVKPIEIKIPSEDTSESNTVSSTLRNDLKDR